MLDLNDPCWGELRHAYGHASDTPDLLRMLEANPDVQEFGGMVEKTPWVPPESGKWNPSHLCCIQAIPRAAVALALDVNLPSGNRLFCLLRGGSAHCSDRVARGRPAGFGLPIAARHDRVRAQSAR